MSRKPGIPSHILQDALNRDGSEVQRLASDYATDVHDTLTEFSHTEQLKSKGVMAGGAAIAADGFRRLVSKDDDGKRHLVRGAIQTAAGIGLFTAALNYERNYTDNAAQRS